MNTHESISHLTGMEQGHLRQVKNSFVRHLQPMVIFCFGCETKTVSTRGCTSLRVEKTEIAFSCSLLVILPDNVPEGRNAGLLATELTASGVKVHAIIHSLRCFLKEVDSGSLFFNWVRRSAVKLYDRGDAEIWLPPKIRHLRQWKEQADEFFRNGGPANNYLSAKLVNISM